MKSRGLRTRTIALLSITGLLLAALVSIAISKRVARAVSGEVQSRIVDIVFDSVAAGPVAFARLHSSAIANEQLGRLMSTSGLNERGIHRVQIQSGGADAFSYALWNSGKNVDATCTSTMERKFEFDDAIHPFVVKIDIDQCATLGERKKIFAYSAIASCFIVVTAGLILFSAFWPMFSSVSRAETFLAGKSAIALSAISLASVRRLVEEAIRVSDLERQVAVNEIASQVSHDIRSPLSVLNMIVKSVPEIPEDKRQLIGKAAARINQIAEDLLNHQKSLTAPAGDSIVAVLQSIFEEKSIQYANRPEVELKLDLGQALDSRATVENAAELSRVLSNLLNNSYEAVASNGTITMALRIGRSGISVIINDTGKGIAPELLQNLGLEKISHGKSGSGLGLYHARKTIEAMSGKLAIQSEVGFGTQVTLTLPATGAQ